MYNILVIIVAILFLVALTYFTWRMLSIAAKVAKNVYNKHVAKKIVNVQFWKFKLDVSPHAVPYVILVAAISGTIIWLVDSLIILLAEHAM